MNKSHQLSAASVYLVSIQLKHLSKTLWVALLLGITPHISNAALFNINFDNADDGSFDPPFVGSGTFGFDGVATDGFFALSSLTNYNFDFDFSGDTFSNADITTPINEVLIVISSSGTQVNFANTGLFSGSYGGSLDFENLANTSELLLTFEPGDGSLPLPTLYYTGSFYGNYSGQPSSVPIPAAVWLFGSGLLGLVGMARRKRTV